MDLASFTLFLETDYVCLSHFWGNFTKNITKVCLKNYQNKFQDIPDYPIIQKQCTKNNLRQSPFSKKSFFFSLPKDVSVLVKDRALNF